MRLRGKKVAFLVADGVEELEFFVPYMRLQEEGEEVISAGVKAGMVKGKTGLDVPAETTIESLRSGELFALVVPGGWAPDKLR
ncbi:MAG: type 1 glutamine amidotransferase, partial [Acidobacteria bacterium]